MARTLTFINDVRLKWVLTAYDEILQAMCFAEDLESFEHAAMEAAAFLFEKVGRVSIYCGIKLTSVHFRNSILIYRMMFVPYFLIVIAQLIWLSLSNIGKSICRHFAANVPLKR